MPNYNYEKIREHYHSLTEIKKIFEDAAIKTGVIDGSLISEYEEFIEEAENDLPGLLKDFDETNYFSHVGGKTRYYRVEGIKVHIARNLGALKVKLDNTVNTPVTEAKSFHFVGDDSLRIILERDYQEIQKGIIAGNWKSAIILCGGSIEAILLDLLQKDQTTAKTSSKAPQEPNLDKWNLDDLIEVAVETDLVNKGAAKLSHSVREYRNLIHPGVELRSKLNVEPEEAKIAVEVLNILIRELA